METNKPDDDVLKKHIDSIVKPIFEKAAKETAKNPISVGQHGNNKNYSLYQPHNFRRYYDFSKTNFNPETAPKSAVTEHKILNRTEHTFNPFLNCRITVKKNQVEVINKIEPKRWYKIELDNIDYIKQQIKDIIIKKENECYNVLQQFIAHYGGFSTFKILNRKSEDKVEHEDIIDLLPLKQKFHNPPVKKVYNEKNIEFNDPVFASNYLRTRAIEDRADTITDELNELKTIFKEVKETMQLEIYNKKLHQSVLEDMKTTLKDISSNIAKKPKKKPKISPRVTKWLEKATKDGIPINFHY